MKRILFLAFYLVLVISFFYPFASFSEELKLIQLPSPQMSGGKPLMEALKERHSTRQFSTEKLPPQTLSNLLWAAFGLNRPDKGTGIFVSGSHTAPAAHNWQEIDIYVATAEGLYLFDWSAHLLKPVLPGDLRPLAGHPNQQFVADAPVNLIYVADLSKMPNTNDWEKEVFPFADSAVIAENVYLFCASEGLATVVRALFDRPALAKAMKLRPDQNITLEQPVGYPKKK